MRLNLDIALTNCGITSPSAPNTLHVNSLTKAPQTRDALRTSYAVVSARFLGWAPRTAGGAGGEIVVHWLIEQADFLAHDRSHPYGSSFGTYAIPTAYSDGALHISGDWGDPWEDRSRWPWQTRQPCSRYAVGARIWCRVNNTSGTPDAYSPVAPHGSETWTSYLADTTHYAYCGDQGNLLNLTLQLRDDGTNLVATFSGATVVTPASIPSLDDYDWQLVGLRAEPRWSATGKLVPITPAGTTVHVDTDAELHIASVALTGGGSEVWLAEDFSDGSRVGGVTDTAYLADPTLDGRVPSHMAFPAGFASTGSHHYLAETSASGLRIRVGGSSNATVSASLRAWNSGDPGALANTQKLPQRTPGFVWQWHPPTRSVALATNRYNQSALAWVDYGTSAKAVRFARGDVYGRTLSPAVTVANASHLASMPRLVWGRNNILLCTWQDLAPAAPGAGCTRYYTDVSTESAPAALVGAEAAAAGVFPALWASTSPGMGARAAVSYDDGASWSAVTLPHADLPEHEVQSEGGLWAEWQYGYQESPTTTDRDTCPVMCYLDGQGRLLVWAPSAVAQADWMRSVVLGGYTRQAIAKSQRILYDVLADDSLATEPYTYYNGSTGLAVSVAGEPALSAAWWQSIGARSSLGFQKQLLTDTMKRADEPFSGDTYDTPWAGTETGDPYRRRFPSESAIGDVRTWWQGTGGLRSGTAGATMDPNTDPDYGAQDVTPAAITHGRYAAVAQPCGLYLVAGWVVTDATRPMLWQQTAAPWELTEVA